MRILQFTLTLVIACTLSNCTCLVSSKLGEKLDAVGYKETRDLKYAENKPFYELNGCYYAKVRLEYYTRTVPFMHIAYVSSCLSDWQPTGKYIDGYMLMSAEDVSHMLKKKVAEPPASALAFISEADFATMGAKSLHHKGCMHGCKIRGVTDRRSRSINPITLTLTYPAYYKHVPTQRSFGNYALKPLALLVSYGVDAPISLIGSTIYIAVAAPPLIAHYYL